LYALDAVTGAVRWTYTTDADVASSPSVADGILYISDGSGVLYALGSGPSTVAETETKDSPTEPGRASIPGALAVGATAHLTYFNVAVLGHRSSRDQWGVNVAVCYVKAHPEARADGTTRVSTDPWSLIIRTGSREKQTLAVSRLALSGGWEPSYGGDYIRVGECRTGWITVKALASGKFVGVRYTPRDFPGDAATWGW
jgi:hypothetical protein